MNHIQSAKIILQGEAQGPNPDTTDQDNSGVNSQNTGAEADASQPGAVIIPDMHGEARRLGHDPDAQIQRIGSPLSPHIRQAYLQEFNGGSSRSNEVLRPKAHPATSIGHIAVEPIRPRERKQ